MRTRGSPVGRSPEPTMRLSGAALEDHVADVVELLERYGAVLDPSDDPWIRAAPSGMRWFALRALLPGADVGLPSTIDVREHWRPTRADAFERAEYAYELVDHEREVRRAFHLHDAEWFIDRHQVVVHEHCERPVGVAPCRHVEGRPLRDAFAGVVRLIEAWSDPELPDCTALPRLERSA